MKLIFHLENNKSKTYWTIFIFEIFIDIFYIKNVSTTRC